MQTNITLFGYLNNYNKAVAKLLAEKLEMFYVDFNELLEFDLVDSGHIISTLGRRDGNKYIKQIEQKTIKRVNEFENTIITIDPARLFAAKNPAIFKKSSFFAYLQVSPKFMEVQAERSGDKTDAGIAGIGFSEKDKLYVAGSDVVINCSRLKEAKAAKKLIKELIDFFKKREINER